MKIMKPIVVAGFLLLLSPADVLAQFSDRYPKLQEGARSFHDDKFAEAIDILEPALADEATEIDRDSRILALEYLAFSYYVQEDPKSSELIRRTLELDIHTDADTIYFLRDYVRYYRVKKKEMIALLTISSEPAGADVFISGEPAGKTPMDTLLLAGEYDVRVELAGFKPAEQQRAIEGGIDSELTINLAPEGKSLPWYVIGGGAAVVAGGAIYLISSGKAEEELPLPPVP